MTLVIAGHELAKDPWDSVWGDEEKKRTTSKGQEAPKLKASGLFVVADSVITSMGSQGATPILSGHRKIHEITIKVWKPYFVGRYFKSYSSTFLESNCFIAFSGSTLAASHAINTVTEHLKKLEISYKRNENFSNPGNYIVQRHCQYNLLKDPKDPTSWGEDTFLDSDFKGIVTADFLADTIEHSLNIALSSVRKYCISQQDLNNMHTDFVVGIYCPCKHTHHLYTYRMQSKTVNGVIEVYFNRQEMLQNQVAVLGMRKKFEDSAQAKFEAATKAGNSTGEMLYQFLNSAIDEVEASRSYTISRPSIHIELFEGKFKKVNLTKDSSSNY
ncbi:hypothetical protein [Methylotenera versatilis]|uniref:hypothetical protein n=1 Tax=Methylotenera versatilis TaxID=1055487 RepID=UPI00068A7B51|nr:hypothetical protein [Methylotenera versatilis]